MAEPEGDSSRLMHSFWSILRRVAVGANLPQEPQTQPLIAGYRRPPPIRLRLTLFGLLALAFFAYGYGFAYFAPARMMPFTIPIVLVGALVIWALPVGDYAPTSIIAPLFLAFFIALVLWPNYLALALWNLPWVTLLRLFGVPLVVAVLVCLSASRSFRKLLREIVASDPWIWRLLVALVVVQTATLAFSLNFSASLNRHILNQLNLTAIFVVSCYVFTRRGFAELWTWLLLAMIGVLTVMGILEWREKHVLWANAIPSFLKVEDENVDKILRGFARTASGVYRVQGPQTTPLGLAELFGLAVPFAVHLMMERHHVVLRLAAGALVPLSIYIILLTDSRLGVVAAMATLLFYLLFWALLRWREVKTSLIAPAIVLAYPVVLAAAVASTFFVGRIRAEVWGNGAQQASTNARSEQWAMTWPRLLENPFGYGTAQGARALGWMTPQGKPAIDSYYISVLLEWGVIGFLVFYGLFLRAIWIGGETVVRYGTSREERLVIPLSISLLNFVIVKSVLAQDANHPLAFMMLGAIVALSWRARFDTQVQATTAGVVPRSARVSGRI